MKALILAGGSGSRLWPLSRENKPKQLVKILGNQSLLQYTYKRCRKIFKAQDIWLAASSNYIKKILQQLPAIKNISVEVARKNTAPAIGLSLINIWKKNKQAIVCTVNSDHIIKNEKEYQRLLNIGKKYVEKNPDKVVLLGCKTQFPETGYGYLQTGKAETIYKKDIFYKINKFIEKPVYSRAKKYHQQTNFFWNPAIFIFQVDNMLRLYEKFLPEVYLLLEKIGKLPKDSKKIDNLYKKMPSISIDYGIMEKSSDLVMLPADIGWSDIGSWQSVAENLGNNLNTDFFKHIEIDSSGNFIFCTDSKKVVATAGLENCIIVDTNDALLVAQKNETQKVKKIVEELKNKNLTKYV